MANKELFINAIRLVEVDGSTNIPTVLHYSNAGAVSFGSAALAASYGRYQLNEGFKVDLGNIDPTSKQPVEKFYTASNIRKSAVGLAFDFLYHLTQASRQWLEENNIENCTSILVAEPLAMQGEGVVSDWLQNYRGNLRRMIVGWNFQNIDFLPEPFAVFQYYATG